MYPTACRKCSSTVSNVIPPQSTGHRLLKLVAGYQLVRCGKCGSQSATMNVFDFSIHMIYLLLIGEICYLLWNLTLT